MSPEVKPKVLDRALVTDCSKHHKSFPSTLVDWTWAKLETLGTH